MVAHVETGTYVASRDKEVIYWPEADKDGTGETVWEDQTDHLGNNVGRRQKTDRDGNLVRKYPTPKGFENRPSFDHTDNYVLVEGNGEVHRDSQGNAISIKPGQALVIHADGSTEILHDEYARYRFAQSHEKVSADVPSVDDSQQESDDSTETESDKTPPVKKATPATVGGAKK